MCGLPTWAEYAHAQRKKPPAPGPKPYVSLQWWTITTTGPDGAQMCEQVLAPTRAEALRKTARACPGPAPQSMVAARRRLRAAGMRRGKH